LARKTFRECYDFLVKNDKKELIRRVERDLETFHINVKYNQDEFAKNIYRTMITTWLGEYEHLTGKEWYHSKFRPEKKLDDN
jgi:hypothetical protein